MFKCVIPPTISESNGSIPLDKMTQALTLSGPTIKARHQGQVVLTPSLTLSHNNSFTTIYGFWFLKLPVET